MQRACFFVSRVVLALEVSVLQPTSVEFHHLRVVYVLEVRARLPTLTPCCSQPATSWRGLLVRRPRVSARQHQRSLALAVWPRSPFQEYALYSERVPAQFPVPVLFFDL